MTIQYPRLVRTSRNAVTAFAGLAMVVAITGCGGSGAVTPGHDSPTAAVAGFLDGLKDGNAQAACSYGASSGQQTCLANLTGGVKITGSIKIGRTMTVGDEALVATTGAACLSAGGQTQCGSNRDPEIGLPASTSGFDAAYQAALNATGGPASSSFWVQTATKLGGRWYLNAAN